MNGDMDGDEKLVALLRSAATTADTPPAEFGHADVLASSRRITRRRTALATGAATVVLLAGIGTAVVVPQLSGNGSQTAASGPAESTASARAPAVLPGSAPLTAPPARPDGAPAPAERGGSGSGGAQPAPTPPSAAAPDAGAAPQSQGGQLDTQSTAGGGLGPGTGSCGNQQDPELRSIVEDVFPQVAGAAAAPTSQVCRPGGERAVHLAITEGGRSGVLTVVSAPKGGSAPPAGSGARSASAATASGGTVVVSVRADDGGEAPFAGAIGGVAGELGPRL